MISNTTLTIVDASGNSTVVSVASAIPSSGVMVMGSDGTNTRFLSTDTSGRLTIIGAGSAGTPAGGVVTIQGVTGGTPVLARISDGTNAVAIKAASTAAAAADPSLVVALSPNSALPTGANVIGAVTQSGTWTTTVTQATASNLNATVVGSGTAGTPTGGVLSIQGVSGGQPVPISGSISATNPSVSTTGTAVPGSATYIGASDGTNLVGLRLKAASTAAVATDPSLVVALSPNSPIPTGSNVIGAVTQSGSWTSTVTQATAANLNALVAQGAAGTAAAGWFVKVTDGTNTQPTGDTAARSIFHRITDGTNTAAVKAASTAAVATDPALVVALSPNNPISTSSTLLSDRQVSGTITALNGTVAVSAQGIGNLGVYVSGTWTATLVFEGTIDGTNWFSLTALPIGAGSAGVSSTTANGQWRIMASGLAQVRLRANSAVTGTVNVNLEGNQNSGTVRAAQGAPNTLANNWPVQITDGTNTMPTMDAAARRGFHAITDGTNTAAVKAASTAAAAADPALVVSVSPNSLARVAIDPNQQTVHSNATITASGSAVYTGFGTTALTLVVNIKNAPTGTSPTLTYTIQEIDPGDQTTVTGPVVSTGALNTTGVTTILLPSTDTGALKVTWTIGGTASPTFTGVYATVVMRQGNASESLTGQAIPNTAVQVGGSDGTNLRPLLLDAQSLALATLDWGQRQTHQGNNFIVSLINSAFTGAGTNYDILIITANNSVQPHALIMASISADSASFSFYEAPTTTANGSALTIWNKNRNSATTATMQVFTAPTVTAVGSGSMLSRIVTPSVPFISNRNDHEYILKPNTKYLMRFTKASSGTANLNFEVNWQEGT